MAININNSEKQLLTKLLAYHAASPDKAFSPLLSSFVVESVVKLAAARVPTAGIESYLCKGAIDNHSQFRQWLVGPDGTKGVNVHHDYVGKFDWAKGSAGPKMDDVASAALQAALAAL